MKTVITERAWLLPAAVGVIAAAVFMFWFVRDSGKPLALRVPGTDRAPDSQAGGGANPVLSGKLIKGDGVPANLPGSWPQFRGTNFDSISRESTPLARSWAPGQPREIWGIDVGEGYAGPAVYKGRVYLMDYDREKKQDALRCLSLADGKEIWRYAYPVAVKRNHGMSRTVPAITDNDLVALGPKCHVLCVDPLTGALRWTIDLVKEYGTVVPQWYAGQCPFIEGESVILAPAGPEALVIAADLQTGKAKWRTPNPHGWNMTHSSVTPMSFGGERMLIYCADKGVVGVSAKDGRLLWETAEWKISIATVPSPVPLEGGRILFSGGYDAGSLIMQLEKDGSGFKIKPVLKLPAKVFGATQQTPLFFEGHIYGARPDGRFVCLTLEGKTLWVSDAGQQFGLGPFLLANGLIYAMNDSGLLRLIEGTPAKYNLLGQASVLKGHDSWGPMALAGGRLLTRDLTRLVCLDVAAH